MSVAFESDAQARIRLAAAQQGYDLYRNNVGVLLDATGRPVRFGLANDSPQLNKVLKSGDLIGWRSFVVTPEWVGHRIAQFVSAECKRPGWRLLPSDDRGHAQLAWARLVERAGGHAGFARDAGDLATLTVRGYE